MRLVGHGGRRPGETVHHHLSGELLGECGERLDLPGAQGHLLLRFEGPGVEPGVEPGALRGRAAAQLLVGDLADGGEGGRGQVRGRDVNGAGGGVGLVVGVGGGRPQHTMLLAPSRAFCLIWVVSRLHT